MSTERREGMKKPEYLEYREAHTALAPEFALARTRMQARVTASLGWLSHNDNRQARRHSVLHGLLDARASGLQVWRGHRVCGSEPRRAERVRISVTMGNVGL